MWLFNGKPVHSIEDFPDHENLLGFIYKISNLRTGKIYIGKKNLLTKRKKNLTKAERSTDKRKKTWKHVIKESDWKTYYGSNQELNDDVTTYGESFFCREILALACTSKNLSYLEVKHQFAHAVLENESYNSNIMGKFFTKDIKSCYA